MISLNLLLSIALLSLLLIALVIYYIKNSKSKKRSVKPKKESSSLAPPTFEELKSIIKNQETSSSSLETAINQLMQYYGDIPLKNGIHPAKKFKEYASLLVAVCKHKNTNAKIVLLFEKQLREKNPSYEVNIEEMLQRGLNSRN